MIRPDTEGLPWPEGDPAALRAVASASGAVADQLAAQNSRLVASASGTGEWSGVAHDSYGSAVLGAQSQLEEGVDAFQSAAVALDELALVVEQEQERVVQAAARLRDARQAAAAAASAAARAQDAADSAAQASAASPLDPVSTSAAQSAGTAAASAQSRASGAAGEAAQVEARCYAEANAAVDAVARADQATAAVLDELAGFDPLAALGGLPDVPDLLRSALSALGQLLFAEVGNFWADRYAGLGLFGAGLAGGKMFKALKWGLAGGDLTRYPVFNNGLLGRGTTGALNYGSRYIPSLAGPAKWLGGQKGMTSTMASATTVFRGLGIAGGVASTALDSYNLIEQGNPVDAFEREGAGYVADVARTGFSASSTALLLAPAGAAIAGVAVAPVLVGAVVVTGAIWLGAEAWEEWGDEISEFAGDAWDTTTEAVGDAWDTTTEAVGDAWDTSTEWASDTWDTTTETVGDAWDTSTEWAGNTLEDAGETADELVDSAGDALEDAGDAITFWD